ncbi:pyridoxal phosphate-dependent transferase [Acrodontium crateriforme]|uniref:Pyridoxal phosphate-dependent transferase n=1 Tax=Acrodontium crateriforme TaxID=150365 RepID=A0AAQ3M4U8_9PEZI|nr:pyridoxal phosphate-dependent transferase [Acrodontium crateriforme]
MLSTRGAQWSQIDYTHGEQNFYHPIANPNGVVSFANAENFLMHQDLIDFINSNSRFDASCCSYGEMFTGTNRLRTAMAMHLNTHFQPAASIDPEQITFAAGVTALNETIAMMLCDDGERIMLGRPVYGSFFRDLTMRTGVKLHYVSVGDTDQFTTKCVADFEKGYDEATSQGIKIRALIICNPHNPLGHCYSRQALEGLLRFCAAKKIHLISDEIYALSVYNRSDLDNEKFTSVLSIVTTGLIDPSLVHVLYGMSKDFGAGGMRLGCLISRNKELTDGVRAVCRFSSPSQFSMDLANKILENQGFVEKFLLNSQTALAKQRQFAENLLDEAGIHYHKKGNAGFFIWLDLSSKLFPPKTQDNGWVAERLLSRRFEEAGVTMSTGEAYHAPQPGRFRLVFSVPEEILQEGIKRICEVLNSTS